MMKKNILLWLCALTVALGGVTACNKSLDESSTQESPYSSQESTSSSESSLDGSSSSESDSSSSESDSSSSENNSSAEEDDESQEKPAVEELVDFVVEIESGKDPVVLQLSDPQLCYWGNLETYCYGYVREAVETTDPDLILVTGDIVYGKFDESGSLLLSYIEFMESLQIPWAPVFGNHDNECIKGVDWQCAQFEAAEYCLFKQGEVTGNGNYSVGLKQDEELLRVFYMMDSNGCSSPMIDRNDVATTPAAGTNLVKISAGFAQDQIDWYTSEINAIHEIDADVKISFAYHIQQAIFGKAFEKYDEYDATIASGSSSALKNPLNLDALETADETDFGYLGRKMKGPWDTNYSVFNGMKALGVDSIFVGHEHCNSASIVYEGVRFQYGQKSSTYDRYNWVFEDGTIQGDYKEQMPSNAHALMGGTVIPVSSQDGSIGTGYIYYSGNPFHFEPTPENPVAPSAPESVVVNGVELINPQSGVSLTAEAFDGSVNAYKATATAQGKVYIDTALVANKSKITFTVYVSEILNPTAFMVRIKPNSLTEDDVGHVYYTPSSVTIGTWQTFSLDISHFGDACTEFSFIIPEGQTVWFRDITIE